MKEKEDKIKEVLDQIRPFLMYEGGNIEFIKLEDNIVYVKMAGTCANCSMIDLTIKEVIEAAIQEVLPDIEGVVNVEI